MEAMPTPTTPRRADGVTLVLMGGRTKRGVAGRLRRMSTWSKIVLAALSAVASVVTIVTGGSYAYDRWIGGPRIERAPKTVLKDNVNPKLCPNHDETVSDLPPHRVPGAIVGN